VPVVPVQMTQTQQQREPSQAVAVAVPKPEHLVQVPLVKQEFQVGHRRVKWQFVF
jgi:hypothetical protein